MATLFFSYIMVLILIYYSRDVEETPLKDGVQLGLSSAFSSWNFILARDSDGSVMRLIG